MVVNSTVNYVRAKISFTWILINLKEFKNTNCIDGIRKRLQ